MVLWELIFFVVCLWLCNKYLYLTKEGLCWCHCFFVITVAVIYTVSDFSSENSVTNFSSVYDSSYVYTFYDISNVVIVDYFSMFSDFGYLYVFILELFMCVCCFHLCLVLFSSLISMYFFEHVFYMFGIFLCFGLIYFVMFSGFPPVADFVDFSSFFGIPYFCS